MAPLVEGRLGAPAAYLLPTYPRRKPHEHPLTLLATTMRALAEQEGFDTLAALARDATRFEHASGLVWGLMPERRPEVLVVARISNGSGRHALDQFVGIPRYPWAIPSDVNLLLRGSGSVADQEVVTAFGEIVDADLEGLIVTRFLDHGPETDAYRDLFACSDWRTLRSHLAPRRVVRPAAPELFTWSSAFNTARDRWPGVAGLDQLTCLTPAQQSEIAQHFVGYGLEILAAESEYTAVRLAARRLVELCDRGFVKLDVTSRPYGALQKMTGRDRYDAAPLLPEEHGLVYLSSPASDSSRGPKGRLKAARARAGDPQIVEERAKRTGTILVPLQWIAAAIQREIVALVHLVRVTSLARDDSYGKLSGKVYGYSHELRRTSEIPQFDIAVARADGLAARFLDEALRFDTRVYGLRIERDDYCRAIERRAHRISQYPDPPARPRRT